MSKVRLLVAAVLVMGYCSAVLAEEQAAGKDQGKGQAKKERPDFFKANDADGNGTLSLAEFKDMDAKRAAKMKEKLGDKFDAAKAAKMPSAEERFAKLDADKNGQLTKEEMTAGHAKAKTAPEGTPANAKKAPAKAGEAAPAADME
jgi:hypothetical protein